MNRIVKLYLIANCFFGACSFSSCCAQGPDKTGSDYTFEKTAYTGKELRTDGYYYVKEGDYTILYFLYRDGSIVYAFSHLEKDLEKIEEKLIKNNLYNNEYRRTRYGRFLVEGMAIRYEQLHKAFPVYQQMGYIKNDTTFHITTKKSHNTETELRGDWVYHFKKFSPKPDSIMVLPPGY